MHLTHLQLTNFKTYAQLDADFCSNINCLVGNNGVGKTNLLDALYYLSFCKSFFNPADTQNIRRGEDFFAIHGTYRSPQDTVAVSCIQRRGQPKQMRWNKKSYSSFGEHIGRLPLVLISPIDQTIITGGSDLRRKFVDGVISQTDKGYLDHLLQYHKALEQRNRLLKQFFDDRRWDESSLDLWDQQLSLHGTPLYQGRKAFLLDFQPLFAHYYAWITDSTESAVLGYLGTPEVPLLQQLHEARPHDRRALYTTVGPHRDDLQLTIGDFDVRKFGSQGQQKTFVLALKLAQFEYIYRRCGQKPILLLDDVFDKLDLLRVTQLVGLVASDRFGQVFLTDTQPGRVERIFAQMPGVEHTLFAVTPGSLTLSTPSHV